MILEWLYVMISFHACMLLPEKRENVQPIRLISSQLFSAYSLSHNTIESSEIWTAEQEPFSIAVFSSFLLLIQKLVVMWFRAIYYMTTLAVEIVKFNLFMIDCGQTRVQKFFALCRSGLWLFLNSGGIWMVWRNAGWIYERKTLFRMKKINGSSQL